MLDVARGHQRFDDLVSELAISRRVLADRLAHLVDRGLLERTAYQDNPPRFDYRLTARGRALLPVLVGLQDWGDRWVLGDGEVTATSTSGVLFTYPATGAPSPLPQGWSEVPGAAGCTLENRMFRDRHDAFVRAGVSVQGVSTQRPEEQREFARLEQIPFPLLSDAGMQLTSALRLPTVRVADQTRLRRLVLVIDQQRVVAAARYPVLDIAAAVTWSLVQSTEVAKRTSQVQ